MDYTRSRNGTSHGASSKQQRTNVAASDANKYRPFRLVEDNVLLNLKDLISSTAKVDIAQLSATMMAGALTMALAFINKQTLAYSESGGTAGGVSETTDGAESGDVDGEKQGLQSRILVVSVSEDLAFQYIPIMNCIFAAQRKVCVP